MAALRLKIQLGEEQQSHHHHDDAEGPLKFIYFCEQASTKTIDDLLRALEKYIRREFSSTFLQLVQLMTNDGFLLSKSDLCANVLKDHDHLICIDMARFARENYQRLDTDHLWLEMKDHDASDNTEKYLEVGLNDRKNLFLRMRGADPIYALYFFSIHDLMQIAREKRRDNLIVRYDSKDLDDGNESSSSTDWFLEARWMFDQLSHENLFLLCQLKVGSSDTVQSNKLHLILDSTRLQIRKGEVEILSGSGHDSSTLTDEERARLKELAASIPPAKRSGPEIPLQRPTSAKINKHECEGESSIRMVCGNTNTIIPYQNMYRPEEKLLRQEFTITHIIFSKKPTILPEILQQKRSAPAEKPVSVQHLSVLYQNHDGGWKECDDIMIAPLTIRNEEPRWLTDSVIHVEPDKLFSFMIRGAIAVKGDLARDHLSRQRIHKSFPQPFKLKIVVTDNFGKQSSLIVEHLNKPLHLETRDHFLKHNHSSVKDLLAFIYADDCELEERIFVIIYLNKENELVIKNSNSFFWTLDRRHLRTFEYQARQQKTTELPLESIGYQHDGNSCKVFLLFDSMTKLFYAIRAELTTQTSRTEETIFIPSEK